MSPSPGVLLPNKIIFVIVTVETLSVQPIRHVELSWRRVRVLRKCQKILLSSSCMFLASPFMFCVLLVSVFYFINIPVSPDQDQPQTTIAGTPAGSLRKVETETTPQTPPTITLETQVFVT